MEFNGVVAHGQGHLDRLACAAGDLAGDVSGVHAGFEASWGAARAALGDDDYGRGYRRGRGQRLDGIDAGLALLATALREQETSLREASKHYQACEDASTLRT
ncbi:hypothetical protein [Nonomuraea sp. B1E8]|uniref:hypothetical protein n=1 Tax=unclassified Nonomuraea TaxID=2593643 RepID=UPI00325F4A90